MPRFLFTVMFAIPALAAIPPQPGIINNVQGRVTVQGSPVHNRPQGSGQLEPAQTLSTRVGRAEVLLTPGVAVRLARDSSMTLLSADPAHPEVRIASGRALIEVAEVRKGTELLVDQGPALTRMSKPGLYEFDPGSGQILVFQGQADVWGASQKVGQPEVVLTASRRLDLARLDLAHATAATSFDAARRKDAFYRWADSRAEYLSAASRDDSRSLSGHGHEWSGSAWHWDRNYKAYTFLPGSGVLRDAFGWSYYSPGSDRMMPFAGYYRHDGLQSALELHHPAS